MAYVKQNFVDGNVLHASELNYIEDGIAEHIDDNNNPHQVTAEQIGAFSFEQGIEILANSNLNSYTEFGNYFTRNAETSQSILNMPDNIAANVRLFVLQGGAPSYIAQLLISVGGTPHAYIRVYDGTEWHNWSELAATVGNRDIEVVKSGTRDAIVKVLNDNGEASLENTVSNSGIHIRRGSFDDYSAWVDSSGIPHIHSKTKITTPSTSDDSTQVASTAFVHNVVEGLGISDFSNFKQVPENGNVNYTLQNDTYCAGILVTANSHEAHSMYTIYKTTANSISYSAIKTATGISLSTSSNVLTINNSTNYAVYSFYLNLKGTVS